MNTEASLRSDGRLSPKEFWSWVHDRPLADVNHYELIHGRIVMTPPADFSHGRTGSRLNQIIGEHVRRRRLGWTLDASTGFSLPTGDILEPDVSFVSRQRLAEAPPPRRGRFAEVVPDLVVEVLSGSTARRDRAEKKRIYAASGVREYWLVDPHRSTVTVFHRSAEGFTEPMSLASGRISSVVLPDLQLAIEDIFSE